jgi:hypothetical protein
MLRCGLAGGAGQALALLGLMSHSDAGKAWLDLVRQGKTRQDPAGRPGETWKVRLDMARQVGRVSIRRSMTRRGKIWTVRQERRGQTCCGIARTGKTRHGLLT